MTDRSESVGSGKEYAECPPSGITVKILYTDGSEIEGVVQAVGPLGIRIIASGDKKHRWRVLVPWAQISSVVWEE